MHTRTYNNPVLCMQILYYEEWNKKKKNQSTENTHVENTHVHILRYHVTCKPT